MSGEREGPAPSKNASAPTPTRRRVRRNSDPGLMDVLDALEEGWEDDEDDGGFADWLANGDG